MQQIDTDYVEAADNVVHGVWTRDNSGMRTACNLTIPRGEPISASTQIEAVTCCECERTMRAAGLTSDMFKAATADKEGCGR